MILEILKSHYPMLSDAERIAAGYIINNPDDVIHYSITELAKISGVSETTIYRLIRKVGFKGYQKFKIELAREISMVSSLNIRETKDSILLLKNKLTNIIELTYKSLNYEDINKAVNWILESDKIYFFGVGLSGIVAEYASLKFSALGCKSFWYNDPHTQVVISAGLSNKDIVISVSHSGNIRDVVKSAQVAKEAGAKTIAITSGYQSFLSQVVDLTLYAMSTEDNIYYFISSNFGEIFIIEIVFNEVYLRLLNKKKKHLDKVREELKPKSYK